MDISIGFSNKKSLSSILSKTSPSQIDFSKVYSTVGASACSAASVCSPASASAFAAASASALALASSSLFFAIKSANANSAREATTATLARESEVRAAKAALIAKKE